MFMYIRSTMPFIAVIETRFLKHLVTAEILRLMNRVVSVSLFMTPCPNVDDP
jgi:hypothetical protein